MELWAQRHLGRHSGRHSRKRLSAAKCHHRCQCRWDCSCQKKEQVQLTQRHPRLFSSGTGNTRMDPWASAPRSSWRQSEGVWGRLKSREWTLREWFVVEKVCAHRKVSVIHLVGLCVAVIFAAQNESSHVAYNHETERYVFWTCQLKECE